MKVLIVPMAAMAETHGPSSRCVFLANGFKSAGFDVATCMAKDVNYKVIDGVHNYYLDVPMPLGLPKVIATKTFPLAQKLGITSRKEVKSFDQVLRLTGNLDYKYLKKSVTSIREAIRKYNPDIVYSEFNISAIIAAKKEGVTLYTTVSYPTQYEYSHQNGLEKGTNKLLKELKLSMVESPLCLFDWADKSFCMSIKGLEPISKPNVYYCGSLKEISKEHNLSEKKDKILIYMGNGTISADETLKVAKEAFINSDYKIYISSSYLKEGTYDNIFVAPRWDFDKLLNDAALFINHGGQNSIVDGLIHGVAQIIVPGKIFERKYNAKCVADNKAGVVLKRQEFNGDSIREIAGSILNDDELSKNAILLGRKLVEAGGIGAIIKEIGKF